MAQDFGIVCVGLTRRTSGPLWFRLWLMPGGACHRIFGAYHLRVATFGNDAVEDRQQVGGKWPGFSVGPA